ncbi:MAG: hypothetical protein ACLUKN_12245 [Bacilli bacterium]
MVSMDELRKMQMPRNLAGSLWPAGGRKLHYGGDSISEAARRFCSSDFYNAAVVDAANPKKVVGIITLHDIARCAVDSE